MKIAFLDTKEYDVPSFSRFGKAAGIEFKFFETKLTEDTAMLAKGYDGDRPSVSMRRLGDCSAVRGI